MTQTETTPHGLTLTGLDGKVAVVTGAGRMRSIGRAIAVELARAGCDVVITGTGRPPERYPDDEKAAGWRDVDSVADEVRDLGRRALPVVSDVADDGAVEQLAARVTDELGRVDFVVNNAGAARGPDRVPVVDLAPDIWRHVIDVNLNGTFYMSRAFGRVLVEQGEGGAIVNISSIGGKWMAARTAAYAASKAGIHALTAAMAQELGRDQIRVNAVCPGIIDTFRMDDVPRGQVWDEMVARQVPLGRAGTGQDVAWLVAYLCSDQGSWITGQFYTIDGGTLPGR
ncbi:MAG TPA: SDR family NAD(P)-dependent oxidoreductase [Acidimicrobiia bacterium]|nr:SDR family NAD(P)-dependent oxidoreductase [Acidimicrobiia bacterium]